MVTAEDIQRLLDKNCTITVSEMAEIFFCSKSTVERVMRENNIKIGHMGRKLPMAEEDLLNKIEDMIETYKPRRRGIARALNVSETTVSTYVKRLKAAGRLAEDFSFKKGRPNKHE